MSTTPISTLLLTLASARRESMRAAEHLDSLRQEEDAIRQEIHDLMQESGTKTVEGHGLQLVRSSRKSAKLTDEEALISYLDTHDLLGAFYKVDVVAAKKEAVKKQWPGVEEVVTDVLSVKEAKS